MTLYKGVRLKASICYMYYRMFLSFPFLSFPSARQTILQHISGLHLSMPTCNGTTGTPSESHIFELSVGECTPRNLTSIKLLDNK